MVMVDAASASLPLDMVIEKAVKQAMLAGAAPENAALIVAALAYFTGSCARAGVPLGNRKLGAIARIMPGRRGRAPSRSRPGSSPTRSRPSPRTSRSTPSSERRS